MMQLGEVGLMSALMKDKLHRKSKIAARVRNYNLLLIVMVLILIIILTAVIVTGVADRASENLANFYSLETVNKFNAYLSRDLALVQKVAH